MRKFFVIILALVICLSGCGWNVEIVDPREETVQLESGEGEKENEALSKLELSSEPEKTEKEEPQKLFFSFGGEPIEMGEGDSYSYWKVEKIDANYDASDPELLNDVSVKFSGEREIVLDGYIERNGILEGAFDFIPRSEVEDRVPKICNTDFKEYSEHFMINNPENFNIPELGENETFPCRIKIDSYTLNRGYMMTSDGANVVSFEPLLGEAKLTELQEEMILNFGAKKRDFGAIEAEKTGSLYFDSEGFSDGENLSEISYFIWAESYFKNNYDYETIQKLFSGDGEEMGLVYPSEYYEPLIFEYFGVPAEILRKGELYNAEKDYYSEVFGGGIGDTPYVLVNSIDETEENVVFHISLKHYFPGNDFDMVLTVKLLPEGGYNYISYLPE